MNKITNDMSIVFNSVRNRSEMSAWIMRQWFNPDKHSMKSWYDSDVNANNVLSFVSHNKHFPMSPLQLVDMWSVMPSVRNGLKMLTTEDFESLEEALEDDKKTAKYKKGEESLSAIGKACGGITAPMIQRLERSGTEKIFELSGGRNFMDLDPEDAEEMNNKIMTARTTAAAKYATLLKSHDDIDNLFQYLIQNQTMTAIDLKLITKRERDTLGILRLYAESTIVDFLLNDISRDANVIKSYQSLVAQTIFPRRRGRPSAQDDEG
jgi:hypothetical protein